VQPNRNHLGPAEILVLGPISFTLIGLISNGSGACLVGAKNSFSREPKPPNPSTQPFASRLLIGPFGTGRLLKNSPTFPRTHRHIPMASGWTSHLRES